MTAPTVPVTPRPRILIVEDSATQAAMLADLLEREGFDTIVARNGQEALDRIGTAGANLVLSDVVMPGMDGYELCRRIRAAEQWIDLPIVLLTSLSDPLAIVRGLAAGADHYVTKPYEERWLLSRLHHVLERAQSPLTFRPAPITVDLLGTPFTIRATKEQILELLVSSYSDLVRTSEAVREAERRARFLGEAGELLSSSLDVHLVLRQLARLSVPRIADVCVVDLMGADDVLQRVEIAQSLLDQVIEPDAVVGTAPRSAVLQRALDERATQASSPADRDELLGATRDDALAELLLQGGVQTLLVVPLVARERVLGVLQFIAPAGGALDDPDEVMLIDDLARRAAVAVDNALLYGEAQRATRARDDVLAIVSHDLRNPINTIFMSTSFLLDVLGPGATPGAVVPIIPQLQVMQRATRRANALIQDLLDVSRIEAGTLAVSHSAASAESLLADAALEQAPVAEAKGVTLAYAWTGPDVSVAADRGRISQVFANLVGNAVKFSAAGSAIQLAGQRAGDAVVFDVIDNGAGIAPEHLPHLFDRFWQATQASRAGAGLGLYIVKGIVDAHGGTVNVESTLGLGTRFRFSLPLQSR